MSKRIALLPPVCQIIYGSPLRKQFCCITQFTWAIAFSTAQRIPHDTAPFVHMVTVLNEQHPAIDALFAAVVEVTEEAVLNALCAAHPIEGRNGHRLDALPL